jgi:translation initiation factor IF-2
MEELKAVEIPEFITVRELATTLDVSPIDVIKELMNLGVMATINQQLDFDTAAVVVEDLGYSAHLPVPEVEEAEEEEAQSLMAQILADEEPEDLVARPPVVTLLGHVDHGKTSLLDVIRDASVQESEVGGITQHTGAYQVVHEGTTITFLDTPGHEAFTEMRARGAKGADIAILVVAADDGVMPQTREAISHVHAAHVPMIVALNKMDLPAANPEFVKQQLNDEQVLVEDWGGDVMCVPVSAKTKDGIGDLLESIVLLAEIQDFKANPDRSAQGVVLEGRMDRQRGALATVLIQNGTLHQGDSFVAGETHGHIRAMFDFRDRRIESATPSTPVRILGLTGVPDAGDRFEVVADDRTARQIATERQQRAGPSYGDEPELTLETLFAQYKEGQATELPVILKADVQGSIDPIVNSIVDLGNADLKVNVLHKGVGNISESDIMLATASRAIVIGFNVASDVAARRLAESEGVEIRTYNLIYQIIDDMQRALTGMLEPVYQDILSGEAQVRAIFRVRGYGQVAGCYVTTGVIERNSRVLVRREGVDIYDGAVASLKRFQEDVREVRTGYECGIAVEGFASFEEGDLIVAYRREKVPAA